MLEATAWISADRPSAARRLRQAVNGVAALLGEHPRVGSQRPELAPEPFRFLVVQGFPYIVVYDAEARPPMIVRIIHGARDLPEVLRDL
ncbi:MAG TPA: type II toxin-antitoxin system RelE/ParE family toxin [Caulobacteraceae bacterium]|nr:type II toxin-antitoxin system RelE/ParE family toxin [Caulobacteraceae bacterium]